VKGGAPLSNSGEGTLGLTRYPLSRIGEGEGGEGIGEGEGIGTGKDLDRVRT